ncbi:hypothetical protein LMG33818_001822 [Halomonadaceae bacterium LMG 33818]|uniref:hypothetical protein n=1 Tax=Cernens ardua TaxID=3402176 RepID=UPI003EDC9DD2
MSPSHEQSATPIISKTNWFWTLLALSIPMVGLAFCLYWFFSKNTNPTKRNFAAAALLWAIILFVLNIVFAIMTVHFFSHVSSDFNSFFFDQQNQPVEGSPV